MQVQTLISFRDEFQKIAKHSGSSAKDEDEEDSHIGRNIAAGGALAAGPVGTMLQVQSLQDLRRGDAGSSLRHLTRGGEVPKAKPVDYIKSFSERMGTFSKNPVMYDSPAPAGAHELEDRKLYANLVKQKDTARGSRAQVISPGKGTNRGLLKNERAGGGMWVSRANLEEQLKRKGHDYSRDGLVGRGTLLGNRNPWTTAHELGHHELHSTRAGRLLQNRFTTGMGNAAAGGAGLLGGFAAGSTADSVGGGILRGAAVPAAMSLPMLGYEALASIKGLRKMRAAGATPRQIAIAKKHLTSAWGTYAGRGLAATGGGGFAGAIGGAIGQGIREDE